MRLRAIGLCCVLATAACEGEHSTTASAYPIDVVDDAGRHVRLTSPPNRIISLAPSATEILLALGVGDRLVARTSYDHDRRLAHLPVFTNTLTPSLERVLYLRPDLVVSSFLESRRSALIRVADLGVPLYVVDAQALTDIETTILRLGSLVDRSTQARTLAGSIAKDIDDTARVVEGRMTPTVLYLVWHDPPYTVGPGSYVHEIVNAAGGKNVFEDLGARWGEVSLESIVARDPDWLVIPQRQGRDIPVDEMTAAPGWSRLRAVRTGRIATVDSDVFNRPGPRVARAIEALARTLHPEVFP